MNFSVRDSTINGQRKSFQRHMTEKIANTASAGADNGRMMRQKIRHSLALSIRAASISSSGIVNIYWRSKNTPVGVATAGQITPHRLFKSPSSETTRKLGTRMIVGGIINVEMIRRKTALRPPKRYFDNANAAIALKSSVMSVATTVMNTLFQRNVPNENLPNTSV